MFTLEVDSAAIDRRLDAMIEDLDEFPGPMADEFADWQTEDVNRREADVRWWSPVEIWTMFRARGQAKIGKRQYRSKEKEGGPPKPKRMRGGGGGRPVLRPFLYNRMVARMADLMERNLQWR